MEYLYQIALSYATENEELVERVYHYLKAEGISVFYANSHDGQTVLSGKNQREIFYDIFGLKAQYVALFVSEYYVKKPVPMEEASIAIAKHTENGSVIPIYLDDAILPEELFDPRKTNYFKSNNAAAIANHLAKKIVAPDCQKKEYNRVEKASNGINIKNNNVKKQIIMDNFKGTINL